MRVWNEMRLSFFWMNYSFVPFQFPYIVIAWKKVFRISCVPQKKQSHVGMEQHEGD